MSSTEMNRSAMTYNENHMIFQFTIRNDLHINSALVCSA